MDHGEGLHEHCFWLYGVFVGLAIQQALITLAPSTSAPFGNYTIENAVRLGIFLLLIIRFYLGAAYFFRAAYTSRLASVNYPTKNYFSDFLFGLVHFLSFFALAATINYSGPRPRAFLLVLLVILLYDVLWFLMRIGQSTKRLIQIWMVMNGITVLLSVGFYMCAKALDVARPIKEWVAYVPIVAVSIIDYADLASGKDYFKKALLKVADTDPPAAKP